MKRTNRIMTYLLVAGMSLNLAACGQTKTNESEHSGLEHSTANEDKMASVVSSISKENAQKILSAYLKIKDNLVKTDGEAASISAKELLTLLDGDEDEDEIIKELKFATEHIMDTKDAGHQRDHFNSLSDNIYSLVKSTKANEITLYRQYCPMAFNNKGAYWISSEKEVNNPYFGDMMLHCGSVKETIAIASK